MMSRKILAVIGASAAVALSAAPASADPGNGRNCVGAGVSQTVQLLRQQLDVSFGQYVHSLGLNPGQLIQQFEASQCDA